MTPEEVRGLEAALRAHLDEVRGRRKRSPSEGRQARRSRGRPKLEVSLSQEVVDALQSRHGRTGEAKSAIVEAALRLFLEVVL